MLLGVILFLCSFSRLIVASFGLGYNLSKLGFLDISTVSKAWVVSHGMCLKSNQRLVGYAYIFVPLLHQLIKLGDINEYFSSLVA